MASSNASSCCGLPSCVPHLRLQKYNDFKDFKKRILVATDLMGRGVDIERVNIVINYDFPTLEEGRPVPQEQYLHRVGRAGRFGTKGLAISFIADQKDADVLAAVQSQFEVEIPDLPDQININEYMN